MSVNHQCALTFEETGATPKCKEFVLLRSCWLVGSFFPPDSIVKTLKELNRAEKPKCSLLACCCHLCLSAGLLQLSVFSHGDFILLCIHLDSNGRISLNRETCKGREQVTNILKRTALLLVVLFDNINHKGGSTITLLLIQLRGTLPSNKRLCV